jgi:diguanylate cyclase
VVTGEPRLRRAPPIRAVRVVLLLVTAAWLAVAYAPGGEPPVALRAAVYAAAVLLAFLRACLVPTARGAWFSAGLALTAWAAGDLARILPAVPPTGYPLATDLAQLAAYPLLALTAVALLRVSFPAGVPTRADVPVWLEAVVAAAGATAAAAALTLDRILGTVHPAGLARTVDHAHPYADLGLVALLAATTALSRRRAGLAWPVLAAGGILLAVADLVTLAGHDATPLPPLAAALVATAAWLPDRATADDGPDPAAALAAPVAGAAALALLGYGNWRPLDRPAVILACAALALAGLRAGLTVRTARTLHANRLAAGLDHATGLANSQAYEQRLAGYRSGRLALITLQSHGLTEINDALGREVGAALLAQLGPRLSEVVLRPSTMDGSVQSEVDHSLVARLDDGDFAVLTDRSLTEAVELARRLQTAVESGFTVGEMVLELTASVGVAALPDHADSTAALRHCADAALATAKADGTGVQAYGARVAGTVRAQARSLVDELRAGLERGELSALYQPVVELRVGAVVAAEVQPRWRHPSRGFLAAAEFVPLAEQAGLMRQVTLAVLRQALGQCRAWHEGGLALRVAVDLGAPTLFDARLPYDVARLLSDRGVHPHSLVFEITEDVLLSGTERTRVAVERLRTLGVGITVDDFGRGRTTLSLPRALPVDELKLDPSLVAGVTESLRGAAITRFAVEGAHASGLRVAAAGVTEAAAVEALNEQGCDLIQGPLVSPPLPADAFTRWLVRQGSAGEPGPRPAEAGFGRKT